MSPEEKLAADPYAELNILAAMKEEFGLIEWPSTKTVATQTVVTALSLAASVTFIVKLDVLIKVVYEAVGLIPSK
jgi:preprotein translocase subunit SecE